ncbi:SurA N-terminal domain-containing protein [Mucilaginibacter sp. E4BP6]|uniref:peptidylprolyl isomerase n=1 Tax=Mucilaginibacter sp. E4BP6 TaxID=2723089 RepID=UPI0018206261|nr:peptidyl-prolyl cis-trans isomerase D [Mucilaginibacter sp. E4BP6]
MGFLRNRMGMILVIVIGFAMFAFIAGEVIHYGGSFFHGDNTEMGEINGEKIAVDEFNKRVDQNTANFQAQSHQTEMTPQITSYIQESTWSQEVNEKILNAEMDKLGLVVGDDEQRSLIQGDNPSPQIVQAFGNPQTGQVDRAKLNNFLSNISAAKNDDPMLLRWNEFVDHIVDDKRTEKYLALVSNGLYVNALDAQDDYEAKNKLVNFKYVKLDYASIPDSKVTVTDDDYENYYNDHKGEFKNPEENRSIEYVVFNAAPSKDDSAVVKAQVDKLAPAFKASTNDSLFVEVNADTKAPLAFQRKGQLDPKIDSIMFGAAKGFVYGPYLSGNSYKLSKLVDEQVGPDSVKARHILLPITSSPEKTLATADSIKKLIQSGKSFADLAKTYSADKGSADKGGELGMFGRGSMVPAFEDAVFEGKKGDIKIVTSQYGVHIIDIEDQKGSSKVVKVATVDKLLTASSATQSAAYSKAQAFLGTLTGDNFDEQANKAGLKVVQAPDLNPIASTFNTITSGREIVRWAYKASTGDFSDQVFTSGDQYVVARLTQINPKGTLPLSAVKKQIAPQVLLAVKGKMLADKLQSAVSGASNINQVAQKAGSTVNPIQNIVFANPVIPGSSAEYKLIGTVFGSQPGKLSAPVIGQAGVYVFTVDNFIKPAPLANALRQKQELGQALLQRSQQSILEALKDKANVKDYRVKFL